ncbi:MAG: hypothetical protein MJ211_10725 [Bacteroidales bacterium]|nr:hypothetical protein [Bacteroidales bacterium]
MKKSNRIFIISVVALLVCGALRIWGIYNRHKERDKKQQEFENMLLKLPEPSQKSVKDISKEIQEQILGKEKSDSLQLKAKELYENPEKLDSFLTEINKLKSKYDSLSN